MKAVAGTVLSSETISLRRATIIITKFAAAETGAPPEVVAYSRRASKAFNELLQLHRDFKASDIPITNPRVVSPEKPQIESGIQNGAALNREGGERRKMKKMKMELPAEVKAELAEVKVELMGAISKGKIMKDKKRNRIPEIGPESQVLVKGEKQGSEERKKKKKDKKRNREAELVDQERSSKDGKKRKHLDVDVEGRGLDDLGDRSEQHKRKKRRKEGQ